MQKVCFITVGWVPYCFYCFCFDCFRNTVHKLSAAIILKSCSKLNVQGQHDLLFLKIKRMKINQKIKIGCEQYIKILKNADKMIFSIKTYLLVKSKFHISFKNSNSFNNLLCFIWLVCYII